MMIWFIILSALYNVILAIIDGCFNRLVFRENKALPYAADAKQKIYNSYLREWTMIGVLLLLVLPVFLPVGMLLLFAGLKYTIAYLIGMLVVQWDMIFGKIVFDSWTADTPTICYPFIGWRSYPLRFIVPARFICAAVLTIVYMMKY